MVVMLTDPYFAQQIIHKYSVFGAGSLEAVDFVYYYPESPEQTVNQRNLFLQLYFRFQMLHLNTFVSAGSQRILDQVLPRVMNRIVLRIMAKKEQRAVLSEMDEAVKKIQKTAAGKDRSVKREERITKESIRFLTFLKEQPHLLSERETFVRLADESEGKKAGDLIHQYFFSEEESFSDMEELEAQLHTIAQNIVKKNQRQLAVLLHSAQEQDPDDGITGRVKPAEMTEGRRLYEAVCLLFRERGSHSREWERLAVLTGQRLGPEAERRLRREREQDMEAESDMPGIDEPETTTLRMFAEENPKAFADLLEQAGITELPEFQVQLKKSGRTVRPENPDPHKQTASTSRRKSRELHKQTGLTSWYKNQDPPNQSEMIVIPEGMGTEEGRLFYDAVRLLFREPESHSREWERLAALDDQRTAAAEKKRIRGERMPGIPEMSDMSEMPGMTDVSEMPGIPGIEAPQLVSLHRPQKKSGMLSARSVSGIGQPLVPAGAQHTDHRSFSMASQIPHLNVRRESGRRGKGEEQPESMPSATLQLMQRKRRKEQELEENRSRIQKLEEQIRIQQKTVTRLAEGQHMPVQIPQPNVNDLTRRVMSNLERELRLEKMRKGLL